MSDVSDKQTATPSTKLNSDFWKYWTGQTISNLGSSVTLFALPLLVYKLTGSALNLGISSAADFLPYLLFGLLLGAWVDRVNRKRMMIFTDIGRALIIASIPLLDALYARARRPVTMWSPEGRKRLANVGVKDVIGREG